MFLHIISLLSLCSLMRVKNVNDSLISELVGKSFFAYLPIIFHRLGNILII